MEFSLAGLIGGLLGLVIGLVNFSVITAIVEGRLRAVDRSESAEERATFERKIVQFRRIMLVFEVVVLSAAGYWIGTMVGGWLGSRG